MNHISSKLIAGFIFIAIAVGGISCANEEKVDFNAQIRPILNKNCLSCHGGVKKSGGFSMLFPEEALLPGESGKLAIIPGDPENSELMKRVLDHDPEYRMPLDREPLSQEEIALLKKWIKQGAEWQPHWAFIKPEAKYLPEAGQSSFIKNEIDQFIQEKLQEVELMPSPEADKATLLRRVSLDLTGLPPTPEEVKAFLEDSSPDAYEKAVDKLLASPHYGERWASMWTDLARYADSKGYEKDDARKNMWRFRDYIIQAFNEDLPYDQFTIEQLAGDLLPEPTDDQLIATAFHRNTMNNDEGGTDDEEFRVAAVIDRVNTTWDVWQGVTMSCVQCHSHPYDPIRHEEYYSFMAYFNNTRDEDVPNESPNLHIFQPEDDKELTAIKNWIQSYSIENEESTAIKELLQLVKIGEPKIHSHSFEIISNGTMADGKYMVLENEGKARLKALDLEGKEMVLLRYGTGTEGGILNIRTGSMNGPVAKSFKLPKTESNWNQKNTAFFISPVSGKQDIYFEYRAPNAKGSFMMEWVLFNKPIAGAGKPGFAEVQDKILKIISNAEKMPVMIENPEGFRRETHIFDRGNWTVLGEKVDPGIPAFLNPLDQENRTFNRLEMAQWLVSKENPLTARVAVNRFWEQIFGFGLVETLEDFGSQGIKPTHPELLDWLAVKFMDDYGWSMKQIIKLMVMSGTYRQSSAVLPEHLEKDAANKYLARVPRVRLSSEQLRDQALAVSGLLSKNLYGPSVMPHQPEGIWQAVYSGLEWKLSEGEDKYRRALYTFWRRTSPYPSMLSFDAPSREFCMPRRIRTNTPLQALVTLNDTVYVEAAIALADKMYQASDQLEGQIIAGYERALMKKPEVKTIDILVNLYNEANNAYQENPERSLLMVTNRETADQEVVKKASLAVVANAIMNLDSFITKE